MASQKREPRPGEPGFTWYAKIPEKMNLSGLKRIRKGKLAAKKTVKSKRQHDISRKLIKMKQKANSKSADLRPIKVSVQGKNGCNGVVLSVVKFLSLYNTAVFFKKKSAV